MTVSHNSARSIISVYLYTANIHLTMLEVIVCLSDSNQFNLIYLWSYVESQRPFISGRGHMRSKRRVRERRLLRPHWWLVLSSWGLGGSKLRGNRVPSCCLPTTCSRCPRGSILCGSEAKWTVLCLETSGSL